MNHELFWSVFLANVAYTLFLAVPYALAKLIARALRPRVLFAVPVQRRDLEAAGLPHFNVVCPDGQKRHDVAFASKTVAEIASFECDHGRCQTCGNSCRTLGPHVVAECTHQPS